jgi:hypothetical protein
MAKGEAGNRGAAEDVFFDFAIAQTIAGQQGMLKQNEKAPMFSHRGLCFQQF